MIELTFREKKTLETLKTLSEKCGETSAPTIEALARKAFPGKRPWTVADRIVRNSLRRLVKVGLVTRRARGVYQVPAQDVVSATP